ncbi:ESPR-type extended signal peptide-containing protein, partial [Stenotrophomonas maltophilia]|uniref:ESPR-type extended signal peptide-containing protein n=1 Tax=Stenotrophomonas maltophilia TaxID=40324 RepID=UPI0039C174CA
MNKIYRRLWSTARQCWVVASELTAPRGKPARRVGSVATRLAVVLLMGGASATAQATIFHGCDSNTSGIVRCLPFIGHSEVSYANASLRSSYYLAVGGGAYIDGSWTSVFGNDAKAYGDRSSVFGHGAESRQGYNAVFGAFARADGVGASVFGQNASARGNNSIAVGSGASADTGGGIGGIAIGGNARAGTAGWSGAIALGANAEATHDGVALGHHASTTASGAVALGRGSVASEANTVSVGNASTKRRVVNVADARLSTTSTDAVTGKQLHQTNTDLGVVRTTANTAKSTADEALANTRLVTQTSASSAIRLGGDNTGTVINVANKNGTKRVVQNIANGVVSATSTDAVTGQQLHATNQDVAAATTTAGAAKNSADTALARTVALGNGIAHGAAISDADKAIATASGATAMGRKSEARALGAIALGDGAGVRNSTSSHSIAIGTGASTGGYTDGIAIGRESGASGGVGSIAVGLQSRATHARAVALGAGSATTGANQISVGNDELKRKIVNVADAALNASSTEAVTGKQLHATNSNVTTAQNTATAAQTT